MKRTGRTFMTRLASVLFFAPLLTFSGEIFSGRFYTVPVKIYVNQPFEIHFELEITAGNEIENLRISDFPNNQDLITVGRLETVSRQRLSRDGRAVELLRYATTARCHRPVEHTFTPAVQCMLSERRNVGFFSHWQSHPLQKQLAPFTLRVLPLPKEGKPENFSGAMGLFRLTGKLSQSTVRPGDIVTLSMELSGQGWLNNVAMPQPPISPLFKSYPTKETSRSDMRVTSEQVIIPQSTNAIEVAAATFNFFNPSSGLYEESVAGPFHLTFEASAPQAQTSVRVIDTSRPADATPPGNIPLERMHVSLHNVKPLLIAFAGTLAAFFSFFLLRPTHPRIAAVICAIMLLAGILTGQAFKGRRTNSQYKIEHRTEARFAPAPKAATLFTLTTGAVVTPIESHEGWLRVDYNGRRGWIPQASCSALTD